MPLLSLAAYGKAHGASRQAAAKWRDRGVLVLDGDKIDVEQSDARMRDAGLGRFKIEAAEAQPARATKNRNRQPPARIDDLKAYRAAVALVCASRKASASYLQRQMRIGYNQAAQLLERMQTEDIVGAPDHVGRREVLADYDDVSDAIDEVVTDLEASAADGEIDDEIAPGFIEALLDGRFRSKADAAAIKENGLALKHLLAAQKAAGQLIDIQLAESVIFDDRRQARDAWMNWPDRIGPLLAADLDIDVAKLVEAIRPYVHEQLEELGEPELDFRPDGQD